MARNKPFDPSRQAREALKQRRQDFAAAGLEPETADLATMADVQVVRESQKHGKTLAWRSNVFRILRERKTITDSHYHAAEQFCELWATWKGLDGKAEAGGEMVDNGRRPADQRCLVSDRQVKAGRDMARLLAALNPINAQILTAFAVATVEEDRAMHWRGVLQRLGIEQADITVDGQRQERQAWAMVCALSDLQAVQQPQRREAA